MFGGFGGRDPFADDPMFGDIHRMMSRQMREMDSLMGDMMFGGGMGGSPFGMLGRSGPPRIGYRNPRDMMLMDDPFEEAESRRGREVGVRQEMGFPFGGLLGGGMLGGMMHQMESMRDQALNDPNSHVITHSTVVSYGPGEDGRPQYYEATNDVRKAGKVKEVRKTVRDSAKEEERISIGHHIGEKGHVIEKRRGRDGTIKEKQRFHGLDHKEAEDFDREWTSVTRKALGGAERPHSSPSRRAIQSGSRDFDRRRRSRDARGPIIEEVDDDLPSSSSAGGTEPKKRRGFFGGIFKTEEEGGPEHSRERKKGSKGPIIQEMD